MTEHKSIFAALVAAQSEFGKVTKGSINPAFRSKYADLSDVAGVVIPTLSQHGVAVIHYLVGDDLGRMRTEFIHAASDTRVACDVPLLVQQNNMQGMKSATTYAKRIGLESLSGIAPEDDDGNDAAKAPPKKETPKPKADAPKAEDSPAVRADRMIAALKKTGIGVTSRNDFTAALDAIREADPEQAARVDAEMETQRANADLGGDGIPY